MNARRNRHRAIVAAAFAVLLLGACSEDGRSPQTSSATHFLEICSTTCAAGFDCVCGACTRPCVTTQDCSSILASATCVAVGDAYPSCSGAGSAEVCNVACRVDGDCSALPAAPHCDSGFCRARSSGKGGTNPDGGNGGGGSSSSSGGSSPSSGGGASGAGASASGGTSSSSGGASGDAATDSGAASNDAGTAAHGGSAGSGGTSGIDGSVTGAEGSASQSCVLGAGKLGSCVLGLVKGG